MTTTHKRSKPRQTAVSLFRRGRGERGAVLIHVAISLVALIAFNGLVVDYGILWLARRQAQNAADAGAMAGAVSMAFYDMDDQDAARAAAIDASVTNYVWGEVPDITDADVTFPPCPPGSPGEGEDACIRVDVFRNQRTDGNPLPTVFGTLFGVTEQGVKATATAEVLFGSSVNCVRPWAIGDKWEEYRNDVTGPAPSVVGWDPADTFERYDKDGNLLPGDVDFYQPWGYDVLPRPPYKQELEPNGTGFTRESITNGGDYGLKFTLKPGNPNDAISPGWFYPVVTQTCCGGGGGTGAYCYEESIKGCPCEGEFLEPPTVIQNEPGDMIGPTRQGVDALYAMDPDAQWDQSLNDGRGGISGGCMDPGHEDHPCDTINGWSPRLVPIPVFNPDTYDKGRGSGRIDIEITKLVGFFVLPMNGNDVEGHLMEFPTVPRAGPPAPESASFLISIALVR